MNQTTLPTIRVCLFDLGRTLMTPSVAALVTSGAINPVPLLQRHADGDWGELDAGDARLNTEAVVDGSRILSSYAIDPARCDDEDKLWIITEAAGDDGLRACTTLLLPHEH